MSKKQIARILKHHGIPSDRLESFCRLINGGSRAADYEFRTLTRKDPRYKAALETCLDVISEPFVRLFGDVPNKRAIAMAGKE